MIYYTKARLFPTVLTAIPSILLLKTLVSSLYYEKLQDIYSGLPIITDVVLSSAIIFLLVQINRFISKEVFQRVYFIDELKMPTTTMLLKSDDTIDESIKEALHNKINSKFNITLLSYQEENNNELKARSLITAAVSQIRNILRGNKMLLQHNIEYGFIRNLIGGSLLAFIISVSMIIYNYLSEDFSLQNIWIMLAIVYLIPLIFSKLLISRYGRYYSKILFEQFLSE